MATFEEQFMANKGKPIVYNGRELKLAHDIILSENLTKLTIRFLEVNSNWRQGIIVRTDGEIQVNNYDTSGSGMVFWHDTAPAEIKILVSSKNKILTVYIVWDVGNGVRHSGHNGAAMYIEEIEKGWRFECNDDYPDDDLDDLIFSIAIDS